MIDLNPQTGSENVDNRSMNVCKCVNEMQQVAAKEQVWSSKSVVNKLSIDKNPVVLVEVRQD